MDRAHAGVAFWVFRGGLPEYGRTVEPTGEGIFVGRKVVVPSPVGCVIASGDWRESLGGVRMVASEVAGINADGIQPIGRASRWPAMPLGTLQIYAILALWGSRAMERGASNAN